MKYQVLMGPIDPVHFSIVSEGPFAYYLCNGRLPNAGNKDVQGRVAVVGWGVLRK